MSQEHFATVVVLKTIQMNPVLNRGAKEDIYVFEFMQHDATSANRVLRQVQPANRP